MNYNKFWKCLFLMNFDFSMNQRLRYVEFGIICCLVLFGNHRKVGNRKIDEFGKVEILEKYDVLEFYEDLKTCSSCSWVFLRIFIRLQVTKDFDLEMDMF